MKWPVRFTVVSSLIFFLFKILNIKEQSEHEKKPQMIFMQHFRRNKEKDLLVISSEKIRTFHAYLRPIFC